MARDVTEPKKAAHQSWRRRARRGRDAPRNIRSQSVQHLPSPRGQLGLALLVLHSQKGPRRRRAGKGSNNLQAARGGCVLHHNQDWLDAAAAAHACDANENTLSPVADYRGGPVAELAIRGRVDFAVACSEATVPRERRNPRGTAWARRSNHKYTTGVV
jgi:hypothetical protein